MTKEKIEEKMSSMSKNSITPEMMGKALIAPPPPEADIRTLGDKAVTGAAIGSSGVIASAVVISLRTHGVLDLVPADIDIIITLGLSSVLGGIMLICKQLWRVFMFKYDTWIKQFGLPS